MIPGMEPPAKGTESDSRLAASAGLWLAPLLHVTSFWLTLEEVEPLRQAVREGDKKKALSLVTPAMANTFCIVGDASACLEKVRSLERAGLTHLIATAGLRQTADLTMRSMETYAECIVEPYRTASGEKR